MKLDNFIKTLGNLREIFSDVRFTYYRLLPEKVSVIGTVERVV